MINSDLETSGTVISQLISFDGKYSDQDYIDEYRKFVVDGYKISQQSSDDCRAPNGDSYQIYFNSQVYKDGVERQDWTDDEEA